MDASNAGSAESGKSASGEPRRNFLVEAAAMVVGGILMLFPLASGMLVFLDPVLRKKKAGDSGLVRVATLDSVPDDGIPRSFPVIASRQDAWNYFPNEPVGAVYIRRQPGEKEVQVFNVICPHLGCFVGFRATNFIRNAN